MMDFPGGQSAADRRNRYMRDFFTVRGLTRAANAPVERLHGVCIGSILTANATPTQRLPTRVNGKGA